MRRNLTELALIRTCYSAQWEENLIGLLFQGIWTRLCPSKFAQVPPALSEYG